MHGYFEMRARLPAGRGLLPAFWMLPADGSWPPELDVMEMLGDDPTRIHQSVHPTATGHEEGLSGIAPVADTSDSFHTYGVDWEADFITWYVDGQRVFQAATPSNMTGPMYMVVNLAVGGDWPGNPDPTTAFPAMMEISQVRAYSVTLFQ